MARVEMHGSFLLQYNADKSAASLVYYALKRLRKLDSRLIRHVCKLCVKSLIDKLVKILSEDIGLPNLFGSFLKLFEKISDLLEVNCVTLDK